MYHSIESMPKDTIMRSLHVPPKRFEFQMMLLKFMGYKGLSINKLMPYLNGEKHGKVVGITFDDGYGNTGSCESAVTFIDGDKGILRYRGYDIAELAEKSTFLESAYLLLYGNLPSSSALPDSSSACTAAAWPMAVACISPVKPLLSFTAVSQPAAISACMHSISLLPQAIKNAV